MTNSIEAWLRLPMLSRDESLVQARATAARSFAPRIRRTDALDLVRVIQGMPMESGGFEGRLLAAMHEGTGRQSGASRRFELACFATACAHALVPRDTPVSRIVGHAAGALAISHVHPSPGIVSLAAAHEAPRAPSPEAESVDLPAATQDAKAEYDAALKLDDAQASQAVKAARAYVKLLENRDKALSKALKTATSQSTYWQQAWVAFAWLSLGEDAAGTTYLSMPLPLAVVALGIDLTTLSPDASPQLPSSAMLRLILGARGNDPVSLIAVREAVDSGLSSRLTSSLQGNAAADFALFSRLLIGPRDQVPTITRAASDVAVTVFREQVVLRSSIKEAE